MQPITPDQQSREIICDFYNLNESDEAKTKAFQQKVSQAKSPALDSCRTQHK